MFLHTFYTWLLANLLHPLMLAAGVIVTTGNVNVNFNETINFLFQILFYSMLFSLPCLLLSWLFLGIIVFSGYLMPVKFILWLLVTALLIFLEVFIILYLSEEEIEWELLLFALPATAATWMAIAFRWNQFKNLITQQTKNYEDDLV
jgi:hypothetical protein